MNEVVLRGACRVIEGRCRGLEGDIKEMEVGEVGEQMGTCMRMEEEMWVSE